jgi:hypothetical protein
MRYARCILNTQYSRHIWDELRDVLDEIELTLSSVGRAVDRLWVKGEGVFGEGSVDDRERELNPVKKERDSNGSEQDL